MIPFIGISCEHLRHRRSAVHELCRNLFIVSLNIYNTNPFAFYAQCGQLLLHSNSSVRCGPSTRARVCVYVWLAHLSGDYGGR